MQTRQLPPKKYLRECFDYSPETGELRWRQRPGNHFVKDRDCSAWNTRFAGQVAGNSSDGRQIVILDYAHYKAYRLIFKWMTGIDPIQVDHRDRNPMNNRWDNLRNATEAQNHANVGARSHNRVGLKGVQVRPTGSFVARIKIENKNKYLGDFTTAEAAHAAYCVAASARWGEFWSAR
jgi:hypothetical protein